MLSFDVMAKHTFGEPISEDDILEIQGIEYPMVPVGMRAMRRLLDLQAKIDVERPDDAPLTMEDLDVALGIVVSAVRKDHQEKLREHIEESVPPNLLVGIATAVMGSFSDLDPTQPESSSGGSQPTGSNSTGGVLPAPSMPTN